MAYPHIPVDGTIDSTPLHSTPLQTLHSTLYTATLLLLLVITLLRHASTLYTISVTYAAVCMLEKREF